jgi:hypothetical protein
MANRRSLGDALAMTPDKLAFIHGNGDKQQTVKVEAAVASGNAVSEQQVQKQTSRPRRSSRPRALASEAPARPSVDSETRYIDQILVPLTTRIRPGTANALKRVCLEQKLSRRKPDSAQEIVELALSHWLAQHGFTD